MTDKIFKIEEFVKSVAITKPAHGYDHTNRVRNWALKIAKLENYQNLEILEAAALLHDVGRSDDSKPGQSHGETGAKIAKEFLKKENLFSEIEIEEICLAIFYHNSVKEIRSDLLNIVRDADILDLVGAVGILRTAAAENQKVTYDFHYPKGEEWGKSAATISEKYQGKFGTWPTLPDQINFQISCFGNIKTYSAQEIARPKVEFMKNFLIELEIEAHENLK